MDYNIVKNEWVYGSCFETIIYVDGGELEDLQKLAS